MISPVFTKDPTRLTRALTSLLWILVGATSLSLVSELAQARWDDPGHLGLVAAGWEVTWPGVVAVMHLAAYVLTAVTFLRWIHRANVNVRGFGAGGLQFTPGWSIGYYFIPFLSLVRPYRAMKEIWQASRDPDDWATRPAPPLLGWWWGLFVCSGILGQISLRLSVTADSAQALATARLAFIVTALVDVPLCIVAIALVTDVVRMQAELVGAAEAPVSASTPQWR